MYTSWFRFDQLPFRLRPDPAFLYLHGHNAEQYRQLLEALRTPGPVVTLSGEPGVGKSTWLRAALLAVQDDSLLVAQLLQPDLSSEELYSALSDQFGVQVQGSAVSEHAQAQQRFFAEQRAAGHQALIVCDDAHQFPAAALTALLQLSTTRNAPRVILAGEPSLDTHFKAASGARIRERLSLAIEPLSKSELAAYIRHRLKLAGAAEREIFAEETFAEIHRYTGGVPRLINILCDKSLGLAERHSSDTVALRDVHEAVRELKWAEYQPQLRSDIASAPAAESTPPDAVSSDPAALAAADSTAKVETATAAPSPAAHTATQVLTDPPLTLQPASTARAASNSADPQRPVAGAAPTLILHHRGTELRRVALKEGRLMIGRSADNDLQIDSQWVSRSHCQIVTGKDGCFVEDLGSTNGVMVNMKRVRLSRLKPDDVITLGEHTLTFTLGDLPEPSAPDQ